MRALRPCASEQPVRNEAWTKKEGRPIIGDRLTKEDWDAGAMLDYFKRFSTHLDFVGQKRAERTFQVTPFAHWFPI